MPGEIEISVGDVTDMEARIHAHYCGSEGARVCGTVRGPFCDTGRTLVASFVFHDSSPHRDGFAEAIVTDPCMWSPEMPHLYRVDVQAVDGEQVLAEYHGTIGLHRSAPRRPVDFAPGRG
jgi:hypothetical protein